MAGPYTITQAKGHIFGTFKTRWDDNTLGWNSIAALSTEPPIYWENTAPATADKEPDGSAPYLEAVIQYDGGFPSTLGGRLHQQTGRIRIDISTPLDIGTGLSEEIGEVIASAFRGRHADGEGCGIWFRTVSYRPIGAGDRAYKAYVLAEFRFKAAGGIEP